MPQIHEPPIDPLADTSPSIAIRPTPPQKPRRWLGLLSLLGTFIFTIATVVILLTPQDMQELPTPDPDLPQTPLPTIEQAPTNTPAPLPTVVSQFPTPLPTASSQTVTNVLQAPLQRFNLVNTFAVYASPSNPFTIVPDRPRSEVIQYTVQQGDTIESIARRFGLTPETIAWSNSRRVTLALFPGDVINILPVDGVYYTAVGARTVREVAELYKVDDPYVILNSEFNNLRGLTPDSVIPSGAKVVIPGGQAEPITWNAPVETDANGYVASFARGQPGSCGTVNPSGGSFWTNPIPNGTFVRGYSGYHPALDIAAPMGSPIYAANSGPVVYAGWNTWGYGNLVVLAHGPFMTVYGHMQSILVRCGETVVAGQQIGKVGSTGQSTGPHLHFEIRYMGETQNPSGTPGIGW